MSARNERKTGARHASVIVQLNFGNCVDMRIAPKGKNARVTLPLQTRLEELLSSDMVQIAWISTLIRKKLEQQGVLLRTGDVQAITEQVRKRIRNEDGLDWNSRWDLDVDHEGEVELRFRPEDVDGWGEFITEGTSAVVQDIVEHFTPVMVARVLKDLERECDARKEVIADYRGRLFTRWRRPFMLLAAQIALAAQYGEDLNAWLRDRPSDGKSAVVEAITRLHARATQIAGEVETLLHGGFADGALSRWRTLHEVCIVALFIQQEGEATAQRYLDHLEVDSRDMARLLRVADEKMGRTDAPEEDLKRLEDRVRDLREQYGHEFAGYYGWASAAIEGRGREGRTDRPRKVNPTFFDIEEAVDMNRLRPYYKLASGAVHAGPKGAFFKLGLLPGYSSGILAGPSNAGLSEPGRLTAWSLAMTCVALMMVEPALDGLLWGGVIREVGVQAADAFLATERQLQEDECEGGRQGKVPAAPNSPRLRVAEKPSVRMRRRLSK